MHAKDLKLTVKLGSNLFSFDGEAAFSEVRPLLDSWLTAARAGDQAAIDAVTTRLQAKGHELREAVENTR